MNLTQTIQKLGRNDARMIGRDTFLVGMFGYCIFLAFVMRYGLPWAANYVAANESFNFNLEDWYPMLVAFGAIFMGGMFAGIIFGFVLLDEKDDDTITAMLVTPMPIQHYLLYRVGMPTLIGFVIIVINTQIINLVVPPPLPMFLIGLSGALLAPIAALFFATFAQNKVQGFALTKFTGTAGLLIMIAWFVNEPWQYLFGLFPPYWVSKAYWMVLEGNSWWWVALILAFVTQITLIAYLLRRFNHVIYQQ